MRDVGTNSRVQRIHNSGAEPRTHKVWKQSESGRTPEVPLHALLLPVIVYPRGCPLRALSHASDHSSAIFKNKYRGWQGSKELEEGWRAINGQSRPGSLGESPEPLRVRGSH